MPIQQNDGRAAIVTTLRNAGAVIDSFVAYHLANGFRHMFLFFDDPRDPDLHRLAANPSVTTIAHDAALHQAWSALPQYAEQSRFVEREVMARQWLNAALAMQMARDGARNYAGFEGWIGYQPCTRPQGRAGAHGRRVEVPAAHGSGPGLSPQAALWLRLFLRTARRADDHVLVDVGGQLLAMCLAVGVVVT